MHLSPRELATVLAALRYWQRQLADGEDGSSISLYHFTESVTPLSTTEIDEFCERLNCYP
jgi:hypothetical protein